MASQRPRLQTDITVHVSRDGLPPVEIALEQLTPQSVARVFSLDPTTVWLQEEGPGSRAYFPNPQNTQFVLSDDVGILITHVVAMGSSAGGATLPVSRPSIESLMSTASTSAAQPMQFTATRKPSTTNVKIVQATTKRLPSGKLEFIAQNQTFVDVTEITANLHYVSSVIQRKWGPQYVLVTSDGLKLDDSSGTQGLKFWKVGSRKIYAVKESDLPASRKRASVIELSSSDDEGSPIAPFIPKRRRAGEYVKLNCILSELKEVRDSVEKLFSVTSSMSVPIGLRSMLYDTFKCIICQSTPMVPPIIFAKCCKTILGCEHCVDTWYRGAEGQTRTCPKCRSDRAYLETCRLNGLDEFLAIITPLLETSQDSRVDSDDEN